MSFNMDFATLFTSLAATSKPIRTRFAPSPTGSLHIGGIRTALVSYIIAKKFGGDFILRIEDTDRTRYVDTAVDEIFRGLLHFGITPDESPRNPGRYGPYTQSERLEMYKNTAEQMIEMGIAYRCYMSPEHTKLLKEGGEAGLEEVAEYYSSFDPYHTFEEIKKTLSSGMRHSRWFRAWPSNGGIALTPTPGAPYVVRFAAPYQGRVHWEEPSGNKYSFSCDTISDAILLKTDGFPTYHLAHVVDDYYMEITHVVRGSEWLPSAPLHLCMWDALGWERPEYIHLPVILSPQGNGKLSKRNGGSDMMVMSDQIIASGINPDAVLVWLLQNMSLLGNSDYDWKKLIETFSFSSLPNTKPGSISPTTLKKIVARMGGDDDVDKYIGRLVSNTGVTDLNEHGLKVVGPFMRTRHSSQHSYVKYMAFMADCDIIEVDNHTPIDSQVAVLDDLVDSLPMSGKWVDNIDNIMAGVVEKHGKKSAGVIRYGITHKHVSVPVKEAVELLGEQKTYERLSRYIYFIKTNQINQPK